MADGCDKTVECAAVLAELRQGQKTLIGDVGEIKSALKEQNGYIRRFSTFQARTEEWKDTMHERVEKNEAAIGVNRDRISAKGAGGEASKGNPKNGNSVSIDIVERVAKLAGWLMLAGALLALCIRLPETLPILAKMIP